MKTAWSESVEKHLETEAEQKMLESFQETAEEIQDNREDWENEADYWRIGTETELFLGNPDPVDRELRNGIIEGIAFADVELSASQVELRTDPMVMDSIEQLKNAIERREDVLINAAAQEDVNVIRSGSHVFASSDSIERSDKEKYEIVPDFHDKHRNTRVPAEFPNGQLSVENPETLDPRDATLLALFSSYQPNIEADSLEDAVDKANRSYMVGPYLTALGTNARFVDDRDLAFNDVRTELWSLSHDIRSEEGFDKNSEPLVGRIDGYIDDIEDYFGRVADTPFMMNEEKHREDAMDIGIGTYWKDVRIKFNTEEEEAVVEFRPLSVQPTVEEDAALTGFYLGRLAYSQEHEDDPGEVLPIEYVNENRRQAQRHGLDGELVPTYGDEPQPAADVIEEELEKAEQGLEEQGIDAGDYFNLLRYRLDTEKTPADLLSQSYKEALEEDYSRREALLKGMKDLGGIA